MSEEQRQPETENVLLIYCGSGIGRDDKLHDLWLEVSQVELAEGMLPTADERDDKYRIYSSKNTKRYLTGSPGSVYQVPQTKGTSWIFTQDARYQGQWPDDEQRTRWQLEHRTAHTTADLRKRQARESGQDNFAFLTPAREKFARLVSQDQRAALLAQVIAYITAGRV
jgi:hypothetical protein